MKIKTTCLWLLCLFVGCRTSPVQLDDAIRSLDAVRVDTVSFDKAGIHEVFRTVNEKLHDESTLAGNLRFAVQSDVDDMELTMRGTNIPLSDIIGIYWPGNMYRLVLKDEWIIVAPRRH